MKTSIKDFVSSRNACKACTPLGAALVFKGVQGAVSLLHGSQGCSTYMRRYIISHFREPIDIASSNFSESSAVFGGKDNLKTALDNVIKQYHPKFIGVATTCLAETIGDSVPMIMQEYVRERESTSLPVIVEVSTPSYQGTHIDGFHKAVRAIVTSMAVKETPHDIINIFPGLISPADIRYLKEILADFGIQYSILPDYSQTLDSCDWEQYQRIPEGGTPIPGIISMGGAPASIEFGSVIEGTGTAAEYLDTQFHIPRHGFCIPVGIRQSDLFFKYLEKYSGRGTPEKYTSERGRLVDSYFDGHKYVFGKKAVVYGEEDFVIAVTSFLAEIGVNPVLCVSGGESGRFLEILEKTVPGIGATAVVQEGVDFIEAAEIAAQLSPDFVIGNSKGYPLSKHLNIPLIRIGFPIHDRLGGQRLLHIGYRGAQNLFDLITNKLIENKQESLPGSNMYM
ncbi:MAG: nitrogenase component 1 [Endomicrobiales bacterium]